MKIQAIKTKAEAEGKAFRLTVVGKIASTTDNAKIPGFCNISIADDTAQMPAAIWLNEGDYIPNVGDNIKLTGAYIEKNNYTGFWTLKVSRPERGGKIEIAGSGSDLTPVTTAKPIASTNTQYSKDLPPPERWKKYNVNADQCEKCGFYKTWDFKVKNEKTGSMMPGHVYRNGYPVGDGSCPYYNRGNIPVCEAKDNGPEPPVQQSTPAPAPTAVVSTIPTLSFGDELDLAKMIGSHLETMQQAIMVQLKENLKGIQLILKKLDGNE